MFFIFPKAITPEVCDEIITDCKKNNLDKALINGDNELIKGREAEFTDDPQVRKTSVCFLRKEDHKVNELIWSFIRTEYKGSENYRAFYDWHQDASGLSPSGRVRKLSLSLPL